MGYAWIFNKTKCPQLEKFPEYMNILETGLQSMGVIEDSDGTEEETTYLYENTGLSKMTEEDMNNSTDQMMKELQPSIEKIHQRLESIENTM
eukprot:10696619-Heterocapsa_arctica.AAC.1